LAFDKSRTYDGNVQGGRGAQGTTLRPVGEAPLIGRLDGEDMLKMAMERAGITEPPVMPIEATAGFAMLLRRRSARGLRSADCSSATPTAARAAPMA
jgi:hypothetical protein